MRGLRSSFAVALLCFAAPVAAETLTINGAEPANANANDIIRLAVDRFEGDGGAAFAQQVESALGAARFDGQSYFRIVAPESGAPVDGLLTGTIRESVEETPVTEKRKRCVEYDPADGKKCVKETDVDIRCRRRVVTLATTVRLVAIDDGSIRWSRPLSARDQQTWCPDRDYTQSVDNFVAGAVRGQVQAIRSDLAPNNYTIDVRVDESRKGLSKADDAVFRQAIRQTKTDQAGACASWKALARTIEPTAPLAFNLGLCSEMLGDLGGAVSWYTEAQRQGSKNRDIAEGMARIERHRRARADWQQRERLMDAG